MLVKSLGHVVLKVRDLQRSEAFYAGVLGMPIISRISDPVAMSFFTLGNHHDFALVEVGDAAPPPHAGGTGLAHVAFKVGDSLDDLGSDTPSPSFTVRALTTMSKPASASASAPARSDPAARAGDQVNRYLGHGAIRSRLVARHKSMGT